MINAFTAWGQGTAGVMTMEYMKDHPLARFFASVGILGTHKHVPEPQLIRRIYRLLDERRSIVIYPEGGRRWDGRPAPWIEATAKLFIRSGVPVYPIITHGSYVGWPRWARYPRPAHIELEILPALSFDKKAPFEESLSILKAPISSDENLVEEPLRPKSAFQPARGLEKLLYRDPESGLSGGVRAVEGNRIVSDSAVFDGRVLPDSRIRLDSTGEIVLTGDLYSRIRALPYDDRTDEPRIQVRSQIKGVIDDRPFVERSANFSLFASHLFIEGSEKYHIDLENVRYVSTERNDKLALTLSNGSLSARFLHGGSVLQWFDELHRIAPNIRW
ncbi:MAG: hypothetical protein BMS9Abin05_0122 [Rhodothermia bacterium]|nr:MAG: hypothetical protein BMS9Abin05_0122 [Rhodothermia bacterium]